MKGAEKKEKGKVKKKMNSFKKVLSVLLITLLAATALLGCGANGGSGSSASSGEESTVTAGVNLREKVKALYKTDTELGLDRTLEALADIPNSAIDAALAGTWLNVDGTLSYTFTEDGTLKSSYVTYGWEEEVPYTCITAEGVNVFCNEVPFVDYGDGSADPVERMTVTYQVYAVENDVLYIVPVEDTTGDSMSRFSTIIVMYKADENGSAAASIAKNPIDVASVYGSWIDQEDQPAMTIDENGLTVDGETFTVSFNEAGKLVAEKDGVKNEYGYTIGIMRNYDSEDLTKLTEEKNLLAITYYGADENDVPNLLPILMDYHALYGSDEFYYAGNYTAEVK